MPVLPHEGKFFCGNPFKKGLQTGNLERFHLSKMLDDIRARLEKSETGYGWFHGDLGTISSGATRDS